MTITPLYAGLLALCYFVLSIRVIGGRRAGNVTLGDGGDASLLRRIRAHGNFAEYVPLVLVLMVLLETASTPAWLLHAIGATLLIGRLLHAYALSFTEKFMLGRVVGMMMTFAALVTSAGLCLWRGIVLL